MCTHRSCNITMHQNASCTVCGQCEMEFNAFESAPFFIDDSTQWPKLVWHLPPNFAFVDLCLFLLISNNKCGWFVFFGSHANVGVLFLWGFVDFCWFLLFWNGCQTENNQNVDLCWFLLIYVLDQKKNVDGRGTKYYVTTFFCGCLFSSRYLLIHVV